MEACVTLANTGTNIFVVGAIAFLFVILGVALFAIRRPNLRTRIMMGFVVLGASLIAYTAPAQAATLPVECNVTISSSASTAFTMPTITGTAAAGSLVTVTIDGNTYTTTAAADGTWSVTLTRALTVGRTYPVSVSAKLGSYTATTSQQLAIVPATCPQSPDTPQDTYLTWQNHKWWVRDIAGNPGNNHWGRTYGNACVMTDDSLRLGLRNVNGTWYSTEIDYEDGALGYGEYTFTYDYDAADLPSNSVLGIFVYDRNSPAQDYREIDIERSKWGNTAPYGADMWYSVQSVTGKPERQSSHGMPSKGPYTSSFVWQAGQVYFKTVDAAGNLVGEHLTTSGVQTPGNASVVFNLWMMNGEVPMDGAAFPTVRILSFKHTPGITHNTVPAAQFDSSHLSMSTYWNRDEGNPTIGNGRMTLPATPSYTAAAGGSVLNLNNSSYSVHIAEVPALGNGTTESSIELRYDNNNKVSMYISGGTLCSSYNLASVRTQQCSGTYDPVQHANLRVLNSGGNLVYQSSSDNVTWTTLWTVANPFSTTQLSAMRPIFSAGYYGTETNTGNLVIDRIN